MSGSKQGSKKQGRGKKSASMMSQLFQESAEAQRKLYEAWLEATSQTLKKSLEAVAPQAHKAEPTTLPYEALYDLWVNTYAKMFNEIMSTPLFAATVGQYLDSMLDLKQGLNHTTGKTLKALGLPTRSDLDEIYQRLISLERGLHELTKQIKELAKKLDKE